MNRITKRIHQSWLLVSLCIGIIFGTAVSYFFELSLFSSIVWLGFCLIILVFSYFWPNIITVIAVFISGIIISEVRLDATRLKLESPEILNETILIEGTVKDDPTKDDKINLKLTDIKINDEEIRGQIFVQIKDKDKDIQRSDRVQIRGKLSAGFSNFDFSVYSPEVINISRPEPGDVWLKLRNTLAERIQRFVPGDEGKLTVAYLLGMKNGLSSEVKETLRLVGLTHLVVASGTHLSIIVEVIRKIFSKMSRFAGVFFSILLIFVFGAMVGFSASITRAIIVTTLQLVAWYFGRKTEAYRIILIAMATTLLISPDFIQDIGWQLSFSAYIGIMILAPNIKKWLFSDKKPGKITEIIITTVSAQIMCLPITIFNFGTVSIISILANIIILPTIPFVMGAGFLTGILSFPVIGDILGFITRTISAFHLFVMRICEEMTVFIVDFPRGNSLVLLLYIPIIALILTPKIKKLALRLHKC